MQTLYASLCRVRLLWFVGLKHQIIEGHITAFGPADCSCLQGRASALITAAGTAHAIVLWLDYDLDEAGQRRLSNGPRADGGPTSSVQGIYLLPWPVAVSVGQKVHLKATFDGLDADVSLRVRFE